jgi:hypothetical protein
VNDFVPRPPGSRFFSKDDREVCPALAAGGGGGGGEACSLAAPALGDDAFRAPSVDFAELHLLDVVVPLYTLDYGHYQLPLSYRNRHRLPLSPPAHPGPCVAFEAL